MPGRADLCLVDLSAKTYVFEDKLIMGWLV